MATARTFLQLYTSVAAKCQDLSSDGLSSAKDGINTVIKEITREFKLPEMFKGQDSSIFVTPSVGVGPQLITLASDISRLESVWWVDNVATIWPLVEIQSDEDWLIQTDMDSDGDPVVYRQFQPDNAGNHKIQIWTAPNTGWVAKSAGKLLYSYWAQLSQLVNDSDVPAIPYELDTILVNGGVVEMARDQGDDVLINLYGPKYEDDKGEMRKWIIKQKSRDGQLEPADPLGVFGRGSGVRGYKIN